MSKTRIIWYIKQLLPLHYESRYREDDKPRLTTWRMWFGRCFEVCSFELADEQGGVG